VQHPETHDKPLAGMHILVDAGNGAGGFFATHVLAPLGADITGSQFLDPDGSFPNHVPNPEDPEAMNATIEAVKANGADIGIVFDTDVDRSGLVDAAGRAINKNRLIALMSAVTLRKFPNSTIVTDSVTSTGLTKFIEKLGGKHFRCGATLGRSTL
jgi:phosphomannomutase